MTSPKSLRLFCKGLAVIAGLVTLNIATANTAPTLSKQEIATCTMALSLPDEVFATLLKDPKKSLNVYTALSNCQKNNVCKEDALSKIENCSGKLFNRGFDLDAALNLHGVSTAGVNIAPSVVGSTPPPKEASEAAAPAQQDSDKSNNNSSINWF